MLDDPLRGLLGMRPRAVVTPRADRPLRVPRETSAVVVGGGIAGVSAALVLAERGVRVTLLEAADRLGGRLGAWPRTLPDGTVQQVEHGFHGFFRQYYTWRSVLRRIDLELGFLRALPGYPVISRSWPAEDFASLPGLPPFNLLALVARSPSLRLRDLRHIDRTAATTLLEFDRRRTYAELDGVTAKELLDRLAMPDRARAVLFEVFSHSFFNREEEFSAAEMIMLFHYYFLGNPEGIGFDAPDTDYLSCIWGPFAAYLEKYGATVRTGTPARSLAPAAAHRWRIETDDGGLTTRHVVLATEPGALRDLFAASPDAVDAAPRLARKAAQVAVAPPFAVTRLWLDRDVAPQRPTFSAVSREPTLDSITVYSRLERPSAQWAARTGGSVVELHSYACTAPDVATATARMRAELAGLWPETADAQVVHLVERRQATAPTFPPGGARSRPVPAGEARGIRVAGDHVDTPFLTGLMERAAASGVLAANDVLAEAGAGPEPIRGVPQRGLLAGLRGRPSR
jgi:carotenoid phi-ring synthase / carotenoid chi-ring synthase